MAQGDLKNFPYEYQVDIASFWNNKISDFQITIIGVSFVWLFWISFLSFIYGKVTFIIFI